MTAASRPVWPIVLLCAVIFVAGGVVGAGLAVYRVVDDAREAIHNPEDMGRRISRRMQRRLDLTDAQTLRVQTIIEERQNELLAIRDAAIDDAEPILAGMRDEIAVELGPAGADGFLKHWQRMRDEWAPRGPGVGPPGPRGEKRLGPKGDGKPNGGPRQRLQKLRDARDAADG